MTPVEITRGDSPIVLGLPHAGTDLPDTVRRDLNPRGLELADTDWHIHRLYKGLLPGATSVRPASAMRAAGRPEAAAAFRARRR